MSHPGHTDFLENLMEIKQERMAEVVYELGEKMEEYYHLKGECNGSCSVCQKERDNLPD